MRKESDHGFTSREQEQGSGQIDFVKIFHDKLKKTRV